MHQKLGIWPEGERWAPQPRGGKRGREVSTGERGQESLSGLGRAGSSGLNPYPRDDEGLAVQRGWLWVVTAADTGGGLAGGGRMGRLNGDIRSLSGCRGTAGNMQLLNR